MPAAESGGSDGLPDLATFYRVGAPDDELDALAEQLVADDLVEAAYVKPPAALPAAVIDADSPAREAMLDRLNDMVAEAVDAPGHARLHHPPERTSTRPRPASTPAARGPCPAAPAPACGSSTASGAGGSPTRT